MTIACYMGPEWHLPQTEEDRVQWKKYDQNYMEKIKETWCAAIDQFAELFPNQQLCLEASGDPLGGHKEGTKSSTMELQKFQIDLPFKPISSMDGMKIAVTSLLIES